VAVSSGYLPAVETLLQAGASVDAADVDGRTPLFEATDAEIVNKLLDAGANVNALDHQGYSALAITDSADVARALLHRGADPDVKGAHGRTPLMSAAWWGALDLVQLLLPSAVARGALDEGDDSELTALRYAAHAGPEVVQALLDARADPNATDIHGTFPLFVAKDRESIVLLLAAGADPNMRRPGPLDTALHERCRHGDAGAVEALLAGGAMADLRASGQTTLLLAAVSGSDDTVLHLLRHASPALINALDDQGTPRYRSAGPGGRRPQRRPPQAAVQQQRRGDRAASLGPRSRYRLR
jgi:ankyrin repeat protein